MPFPASLRWKHAGRQAGWRLGEAGSSRWVMRMNSPALIEGSAVMFHTATCNYSSLPGFILPVSYLHAATTAARGCIEMGSNRRG